MALLTAVTVPACLVTIAFALDRIERRAGHAAVTQLVLVILAVGSSLLLMRKLSINGAGLIWFGSSFYNRVGQAIPKLYQTSSFNMTLAGTIFVYICNGTSGSE